MNTTLSAGVGIRRSTQVEVEEGLGSPYSDDAPFELERMGIEACAHVLTLDLLLFPPSNRCPRCESEASSMQ